MRLAATVMTTATATVQGPPTEAEIREALKDVAQAFEDIDLWDDLVESTRAVTDSDMARARIGWAEDWSPPAGHPGTLWADMRPSEQGELEDLEDVFREEMIEAGKRAAERYIQAVIRFAADHPDIPRGRWPKGFDGRELGITGN
jgi:hypothetical protein